MRSSRRTSARAARCSGVSFFFAIVIVLSEKLVELLFDAHQRKDDSPDVIVAQFGHSAMIAESVRLRKWPRGTRSNALRRPEAVVGTKRNRRYRPVRQIVLNCSNGCLQPLQ